MEINLVLLLLMASDNSAYVEYSGKPNERLYIFNTQVNLHVKKL